MATPAIQAVTATTPGILNATRRITSGATATTVFTVPSGKTAKIATATIANTDTVAGTVSVSVVPSGGTIDTTHLVIPSFSVPASTDASTGGAISLTDFLGGLLLGEGDVVSVTAGTANKVNVLLTGSVSG